MSDLSPPLATAALPDYLASLNTAQREAALHARTLRFTGHSRAVFDLLELYDVAGQLGDPVLIPGGTI